MKRQISVLMLAAGSSLSRVTAALLLMAAAEAVLFWHTLRQVLQAGGVPGVEALFDQPGMRLLWAAGLLLVTAALWLGTGGRSGSRVCYRIQRLPVRRRAVLSWWALYGVCCYFLAWAVQLLTALALCRLYAVLTGGVLQNGQTLFLACYRSAFLHSLLPLQDTARWFGTGAWLLGTGVSAAGAAAALWQGKWNAAPAVLAAAAIFSAGPVGSCGWSVLLGAAALAAGVFSLAAVWKEEDT